MIIAWPLEDICSHLGGSKKATYQKMGIPTRVIEIRDNMAILENLWGDRFPVNTKRIIWHDTADIQVQTLPKHGH